jgi:hypothetical protein
MIYQAKRLVSNNDCHIRSLIENYITQKGFFSSYLLPTYWVLSSFSMIQLIKADKGFMGKNEKNGTFLVTSFLFSKTSTNFQDEKFA